MCPRFPPLSASGGRQQFQSHGNKTQERCRGRCHHFIGFCFFDVSCQRKCPGMRGCQGFLAQPCCYLSSSDGDPVVWAERDFHISHTTNHAMFLLFFRLLGESCDSRFLNKHFPDGHTHRHTHSCGVSTENYFQNRLTLTLKDPLAFQLRVTNFCHIFQFPFPLRFYKNKKMGC